jgi:hypothetical protein
MRFMVLSNYSQSLFPHFPIIQWSLHIDLNSTICIQNWVSTFSVFKFLNRKCWNGIFSAYFRIPFKFSIFKSWEISVLKNFLYLITWKSSRKFIILLMVERKTKKLENETCYDRLMINECLIVYNKKKKDAKSYI